MDANGRDALALERGENGQFVKADIFDHPVSFAIDEVTSVDTPMEALTASLNKYGEVNLEYMSSLVDMNEDAITESLEDIENLNSEVRNGSGIVSLRFEHGTNIDLAFIEVNEKIDIAMNFLPKSIQRPRGIKASATDIPIYYGQPAAIP